MVKSEEFGCIYNRSYYILTFLNRAMFHWTMVLGESVYHKVYQKCEDSKSTLKRHPFGWEKLTTCGWLNHPSDKYVRQIGWTMMKIYETTTYSYTALSFWSKKHQGGSFETGSRDPRWMEVSLKSFTQSHFLVHAALVNRHHLEYTTHSRMYEYTCVCTNKHIQMYIYIYTYNYAYICTRKL